MITKYALMEHFCTARKVAEHFGIEVQAVYQWSTVPKYRELQLRTQLPDVDWDTRKPKRGGK